MPAGPRAPGSDTGVTAPGPSHVGPISFRPAEESSRLVIRAGAGTAAGLPCAPRAPPVGRDPHEPSSHLCDLLRGATPNGCGEAEPGGGRGEAPREAHYGSPRGPPERRRLREGQRVLRRQGPDHLPERSSPAGQLSALMPTPALASPTPGKRVAEPRGCCFRSLPSHLQSGTHFPFAAALRLPDWSPGRPKRVLSLAL